MENNKELLEATVKGLQDKLEQLQTELNVKTLELNSINKPKLIQRVISRASARVLRCFEILSGSPLTNKEITATKPSQINTECPSIANPNYHPEEKD